MSTLIEKKVGKYGLAYSRLACQFQTIQANSCDPIAVVGQAVVNQAKFLIGIRDLPFFNLESKPPPLLYPQLANLMKLTLKVCGLDS